ncbi:MAG: potassium channel family protein [Desulfohalobiaceae bacterium]
MRIVFVGAGEVTEATAGLLIGKGHEVIIIEADKDRIDALSENLDCSFLHGDGSKPAILKEVGPGQTDVLFCLTGVDQANLIAGLVGRSLGFNRIIISIEDQEFEVICRELDLENIIVPSRTISRYLADMAMGQDILELSTVIKGEGRFFTFTMGPEDAGKVSELDIPEDARVVCFYREGAFHLVKDDPSLRQGDEVVLLTTSDNIETLRERWVPKQAETEAEDGTEKSEYAEQES